jgi:hypothetical protein
MTDIYSNIDKARAVAKRLARRNKDVASAMSKRDVCLDKLFESVHEIDSQLHKMGKQKAREALEVKYGNAVPRNLSQFLKLICPELPSKRRSKYAGVLRLVRSKKKTGQSVKAFMRANGRINGCVAKETKIRNAKGTEGA